MKRLLLTFLILTYTLGVKAQSLPELGLVGQQPVSFDENLGLWLTDSQFLFDKNSKEYKEFLEVAFYENYEKQKFPLSLKHLSIKFDESLTVDEIYSTLAEYGDFNEIPQQWFGSTNVTIAPLKNYHEFVDLKNILNNIRKDNNVEYAHYVYLPKEDYPIAASDGVLVKLNSGYTLTQLENEIKQFGGKLQLDKSFPKLDMYRIQASEESNFNSLRLNKQLSNNPMFGFTEPDLLVIPEVLSTNDPFIGEEWYLNNDGANTSTWGGTAGIDVGAFEAWETTTGDGIKIAVIDQGVDLDHPDLIDNLLPGYTSNTDGAGEATGVHGTPCAGIIGAKGDNEIGVAGIAYDAKVIPVNGLSAILISHRVETWLWLIDEARADITSNSYHYPGGHIQALATAYDYGYENGRDGLGVLNFFATGNDNIRLVGWPARYEADGILGVGGMSMCGERKSPASCDGESNWGSNWGPEIDIVAPTVKMFTTDIAGQVGYDTGDYINRFNGTSAATPAAAGAAALILAANPTLTAAQLREIIETTTNKFGDYDYEIGVEGHPNGSWHEEVGYGMISAARGVALASSGPTVIIAANSIEQNKLEAKGCQTYTDYLFEVAILDEYTGNDDPEVTINVTNGTATSPADYEIIGSNVVSFTSGAAEKQSITVRVYNDLVVEATPETINFEIELDAGDTNAVLSDEESFVSTTWSIADSPFADGKTEVAFNILYTNVDDLLEASNVVYEIEDCDEDYNEYNIAIDISKCVYGEEDITAKVVMLDGSTAEEGSDFVFPNGNEVTFNGESAQTLTLPIRFLKDNALEGNETLELGLEIDENDNVEIKGLDQLSVIVVDVDPYIITLSAVDAIDEAQYDCALTKNEFTIEASVEIGCVSLEEGVEVTLVPTSTSVAGEDDFNFVGPTSYIIDDQYDGSPLQFQIEVFDDGIIEGTEKLEFTLQASQSNLISLTNEVLSIDLSDSKGYTPPVLSDLGLIDFEDGVIPEGWTIATTEQVQPNGYTVSTNTLLDNYALHISNDPRGDKPLAYSNTFGQAIYAITSPPFDASKPTPFDFDVQCYGEFITIGGVLAAFVDFGGVGIVPASNDVTTIQGALGGATLDLLLAVQNPLAYSQISEVTDFNILYNEGNHEGLVRMVFLWSNNHTHVGPPPLAVDNIDLTNVFFGNFIESDAMTAEETASFTIIEETPIYYYNALNDEIAMMVNSSINSGCSTGKVAEDGLGAVQYISTFEEDYRTKKSFEVTVENPDIDAPVDISLFYSEQELESWEVATGRDRSELYMIKHVGPSIVDCCTDVQVDITFDSAPEQTRWNITDEAGQVLASGGPYTDVDPGSQITENLSLEDGLYKFTITDSGADGICCTNGNGAYSISVNGTEVGGGAEFESSEELEFEVKTDFEFNSCLDYSDVEFAPVTLEVYGDGFKANASFETGFAETTAFSLSAKHEFTPDNIETVINNEQIEITFETSYSSDEIAYFIFEEKSEINDWAELETVPYTGQSSTTVIDYFPEVGLNQYRVAAVLVNGEVVYACDEGAISYLSTNDFHITPNPATDNITLLLSDKEMEGDVELNIYDESGRVVYTEVVNTLNTVTRYTIDVSGLASGQYYLVLRSEDSGYTRTSNFIKVNN